MRKVLLIILTCFVFGTPMHVAAYNNETTLTNSNKKNVSNRPHVPNRQIITCVYDGEDICLEFAYSEGICDVYLTDAYTGETQCFSIDSSELSVVICVGEIGESYITLITENGNTYEGVILVSDPE